MGGSALRYGVTLGLVVFGVAGVALAPAAAQSGQIAGHVVDATGGVLPGATVTLIGGAGGPRAAQTDAQGQFAFTRGLSPGVYTVTVFLSGFGDVTVDDIAVVAYPVELPAITLHLAAFDEVVVVTATRIAEPLPQVPMSIAAVTGADIERRAVENLTELSRWTPGLTVVDQGARGSNVVIVRGLHTNALTGSEAAGNNYNNGVATYLGDIPVAVDLRLRDIERVEVLLGPQGTLYGAGTLAGAVRYLPRPASEPGASPCASANRLPRRSSVRRSVSGRASPSICPSSRGRWHCAAPSTASPTPGSSTTTICYVPRAFPSRNRTRPIPGR